MSMTTHGYLLRIITPNSDSWFENVFTSLPTVRTVATAKRNRHAMMRTEIYQIMTRPQPPPFTLWFVEGVSKGYNPELGMV